ncbi:HAMP domain-containing histidine kinase [Mesobacillus maritimus]|uniref:sensor histidine kinase n=1 Tax=Mesobacillus maritimus TaxID=1643336 RepID=UPI00203B7A6B|nr:HAMP domain-containing sensor histidine kinase [Mesobacillus maritimus]MCM3588426.1 HAMP domain-containing histidine kinase [Mesobacillus maritimus]
MKVKYLYQQIFSHIGVLLAAFIVLSLLFTQYIENLVYTEKTDELINYGENILFELERGEKRPEQVITQYANVLFGRDIQFSVFDEQINLLNPIRWRGPALVLTESEWKRLQSGKTIVSKVDLKRFEKEVSFVVVPYIVRGNFVGGILLTAPIEGTEEMITQINHYLFYAALIALGVSLLLSWLLSEVHVNRIKKIQAATSMVSSGNYHVNVPSSDFDEIGELAKDFNHMVDKINTSMEEIESLENRRRQFMADVSHEMRTPLTTISGVIEGLKNDMIPEEEREKGINLVSKETKRLIRLVNENLDYEKIRSNQVKLMKEEIELEELLEIIKEQLYLQAKEKGNEIFLDVEKGAMVVADYDRILQILINITKNSIQFTTNGTITLRGKMNGHDSVIEIEDTGIGINSEEIEKIWRRFYKADLSRRTNPYGEFGLGLSIVKRLVEMHNGEITVKSEKNQGTKFTIRIPILE